MSTITISCPQCLVEIEAPVERINTHSNCPSCTSKILISETENSQDFLHILNEGEASFLARNFFVISDKTIASAIVTKKTDARKYKRKLTSGQDIASVLGKDLDTEISVEAISKFTIDDDNICFTLNDNSTESLYFPSEEIKKSFLAIILDQFQDQFLEIQKEMSFFTKLGRSPRLKTIAFSLLIGGFGLGGSIFGMSQGSTASGKHSGKGALIELLANSGMTGAVISFIIMALSVMALISIKKKKVFTSSYIRR